MAKRANPRKKSKRAVGYVARRAAKSGGSKRSRNRKAGVAFRNIMQTTKKQTGGKLRKVGGKGRGGKGAGSLGRSASKSRRRDSHGRFA